jgi:hypothetical protein
MTLSGRQCRDKEDEDTYTRSSYPPLRNLGRQRLFQSSGRRGKTLADPEEYAGAGAAGVKKCCAEDLWEIIIVQPQIVVNVILLLYRN